MAESWSTEDLAALPPSPHRDADLVARRAEVLGLRPHQAMRRRGYRLWPFLVTAAVTATYLYVGVVVL